MPYQVYRTNSANWHLITIDEIGLEAAQQAIGGQWGPFVFWKAISSLGGLAWMQQKMSGIVLRQKVITCKILK